MMNIKLWLVVLLCLILCSVCWLFVDGKSAGCLRPKKRTYRHTLNDGSKTRCTLCPEGEYVVRHCTANTETRCAPCSLGSYNSDRNKCRSCLYCQSCHWYNGLRYIHNCTASTPGKCDCLPGMEWVSPQRCDYPKCQKGRFRKGDACIHHAMCGKGEEPKKRGTPYSDSVCRPCPENTYSPKISARARCRPQPKCDGPPKRPGTNTRKALCSQYKETPLPSITNSSANVTGNNTMNSPQGILPNAPRLWQPTDSTVTQRPPFDLIGHQPSVVTTSAPGQNINATSVINDDILNKNETKWTPEKPTQDFQHAAKKEAENTPPTPLSTPIIKRNTVEMVTKLKKNIDKQTTFTIIGFVVVFALFCMSWCGVGIYCMLKKKKKEASNESLSFEMTNTSSKDLLGDQQLCRDQKGQRSFSGQRLGSGQSSSSGEPGCLVQTKVVVHADGVVQNVVHSSSGDDGVLWPHSPAGDYIPSTSRLKSRDERKDSTSSNSPEEKPRRPSPTKRRLPDSAGPSWRTTTDGSSSGQVPVTQSQPETRDTVHRSRPCPSGHLTPPDEDYVKAVTNKGVIIAEPESGFTDTSNLGASSDNSSSGDSGCPDHVPGHFNQMEEVNPGGNAQATGGIEGEESMLPSVVPSTGDSKSSNPVPDPSLLNQTTGSEGVDPNDIVQDTGSLEIDDRSMLSISGDSRCSDRGLHEKVGPNDNVQVSNGQKGDGSVLPSAIAKQKSARSSSFSDGGDRRGACGGGRHVSFSDSCARGNMHTTKTVKKGSGSSSGGTWDENSTVLITYKLAGFHFEEVAAVIAEGLDAYTYQSFLKNLPCIRVDCMNGDFRTFVQTVLTQWWKEEEDASIELILDALKKCGNGKLRDEVIERFCKLG